MSTPRKRGPQKANAAAKAALARLPEIPPELLDSFVKGPMTPEAVQDISLAFKKALIERALGAEMTHYCSVEFAALVEQSSFHAPQLPIWLPWGSREARFEPAERFGAGGSPTDFLSSVYRPLSVAEKLDRLSFALLA